MMKMYAWIGLVDTVCSYIYIDIYFVSSSTAFPELRISTCSAYDITRKIAWEGRFESEKVVQMGFNHAAFFHLVHCVSSNMY